MAYQFDYQPPKGAFGLNFQPSGMEWGNGTLPPGALGVTQPSRPSALGIPIIEKPTPSAPTGTPQSVPDMSGAALGAGMGSPTVKPPVLRNPRDIGEHAFNTVFNPPPQSGTGNGYAIVDGRRINYQDIGTKADPFASRGNYVMGTGGGALNLAPDANMGLALQDAEQRRAALDMGGVGMNGTRPMSFAQRVGIADQNNNGVGGLLDVILASKIAKTENRAFNRDRDYALNLQREQDNANYNQGMLDLNRSRLPLEADERRAAIDLYRAQTEKERWSMTPEGIAAQRGPAKSALDLGMNHAANVAKNPMEIARNQRWYALQTSGQGYEVPETTHQFNDGQGGMRSYKLYGMLHQNQYPEYQQTAKFLVDATNAYNRSNKTEKDFELLQRARTAVVNRYRKMGLAFDEVDPSKMPSATPME